MKKKVIILILAITGLSLIYSQTRPGEVWLLPEYTIVSPGQDFTVSLHTNSGRQLIANYNIDINFNPYLLALDTTSGINGITPGPDSLADVQAVSNQGKIKVNGFDAAGKGPGSNLNTVLVHFKALAYGTAILDLTINQLSDPDNQIIGATLQASDQEIIIINRETNYGDMDNNGNINIVDALIVAQYAVGIIRTLVTPEAGDVNVDGAVNIVDALIIAQYYVGVIDTLPVTGGLTRQTTELVPVYPGGIPPVKIDPVNWDVNIILKNYLGAPLSGKTVHFTSNRYLSSDSAVTDSQGIATVEVPTPWDAGMNINTIITASFTGDSTHAPSNCQIEVNIVSQGLPTPTHTPSPTPTPVPTPGIFMLPYSIQSSSVQITITNNINGTTVVVTVMLPDPCHNVDVWGTITRSGNVFNTNTQSHVLTGNISCIQVITDTSYSYTLGKLEPGDYKFNFSNWGNLVKSQSFNVPK